MEGKVHRLKQICVMEAFHIIRLFHPILFDHSGHPTGKKLSDYPEVIKEARDFVNESVQEHIELGEYPLGTRNAANPRQNR